jgi:hypothetical protein
LTEQVGSDEAASVRALLGLPVDNRAWSADVAAGQLQAAGWTVADQREDRMAMTFSDIAALIGYVRTLPWAFEDLDLARARARLQQLHAQSQAKPIEAVSHRFLLLARP